MPNGIQEERDPIDDELKVLYDRNCDFFKFFLEYRHKFMVRYLIVVGTVLAASKWLIETPLILVTVLVLCGLVSWVFFLVERRTAIVLIGAHRVGDMIEKTMSKSVKKEISNPKQFKRATERVRWTEWLLIREDFASEQVYFATKNQLGFFTALTECFSATSSHSRILQKTYLYGAVMSIILAAAVALYTYPHQTVFSIVLVAVVAFAWGFIAIFKSHARESKKSNDDQNT